MRERTKHIKIENLAKLIAQREHVSFLPSKRRVFCSMNPCVSCLSLDSSALSFYSLLVHKFIYLRYFRY